MSELKDQLALVAGASGGMGGAIARALAAEGARLVLVARSGEKLRQLAEEVRGPSPEVDVLPTDLGDDAQVKRTVARVEAAFGGLDILIHAAGVFHAGPVAEVPADELDRQYRINTRGPYLLTQLLLPSLIRRQGQVVFINSTAGLAARGGAGAYAASKYALRAVADALREEVNRDGVRVLSVYPGRTATAMQRQVKGFEGAPYEPEKLMQPEDVAATVVHALGLPRTAEVTDLTVRQMVP